MNSSGRKNRLRILYLMGFIFALSMAIPLYVNSSFLEQFIHEDRVGLVFSFASFITFFALAGIPHLLNTIGNYRTALITASLTTAALLVLAFSNSLGIILPVFVAYLILITVIFFHFDVFLERYTTNSSTGNIRGIFLTALNVGILISPFLAGLILDATNDFWKVYVTGAVLTGVFIFFLISFFKTFKDARYEHTPFWNTLRIVLKDRNLRSVFFANYIMRFFFSWMVVYMPIYLHRYIGFDWQTIGILFSIMLLPFVLFEIPAGRLADGKWGEKEMLMLGFIFMAITTASLAFIGVPHFWLWALLLFATRMGASLVEIMTETYFFKHVDGGNTPEIGFFRNARPLAYTTAPVLASVLLIFLSFQYLFVALALVLISGIYFAHNLRDTK